MYGIQSIEFPICSQYSAHELYRRLQGSTSWDSWKQFLDIASAARSTWIHPATELRLDQMKSVRGDQMRQKVSQTSRDRIWLGCVKLDLIDTTQCPNGRPELPNKTPLSYHSLHALCWHQLSPASGQCQIAKTENNDFCHCFPQLQPDTGQCLVALHTTEADRNKQSNMRTENSWKRKGVIFVCLTLAGYKWPRWAAKWIQLIHCKIFVSTNFGQMPDSV